MAAVFDYTGFQNAVENFAESTEEIFHENRQEYDNAQQTLASRCANIIVTVFDSVWSTAHPTETNSTTTSTASPAFTVNSNQGGGRRRFNVRKTRHRRRNISDMSWLRRRVNSLTLKNLQREENRLSEEEDHEMPGRGWVRAEKARRTRRHRRA